VLYRCIRKRDTGQWIDVLFTVAGGEFSVPEVSHRTDIAQALGSLPGDLETVDADTDQRAGTLLALPSPSTPPPSRIQELLAIARSNWTTAQRTELIELLALEITNR